MKQFYCNYLDLLCVKVDWNDGVDVAFENYFNGLNFASHNKNPDWYLKAGKILSPSFIPPKNATIIKGFCSGDYLTWKRNKFIYAYQLNDKYSQNHLIVRKENIIKVFTENTNNYEVYPRIVRELVFRKLLEYGFVPFHASSFVKNDKAIVCFGPRNGGKSTAMLLSCVLGKYSPLANDITFLKNIGNKTVVIFLPHVVSYSKSALDLITGKATTKPDPEKIKAFPFEFEKLCNKKWIWKSILDKLVSVNCNYLTDKFVFRKLSDFEKQLEKNYIFDVHSFGDYLGINYLTPDIGKVFDELPIYKFQGNFLKFIKTKNISRKF
ncbi:MAG: hypothetical protein LBD88_05180 [Candidatus Peribacteria bacterium]|jgi:hypothetical protein|nr:hypothetical protein [Candidatus Peribacteria bacterium]